MSTHRSLTVLTFLQEFLAPHSGKDSICATRSVTYPPANKHMKGRNRAQGLLRSWIAVVTAVLLVIGGSAVAQLGGLLPKPGNPLSEPNSLLQTLPATLDSVLSDLLKRATPGQLIEAVVTFDHSPTAGDITAVMARGVQVLPFQRLPMIGVRGTSSQISRLSTLAGARSIYANRALTYFLDESVPLIGADRVWSQLDYTGRGVTVAVIDSGIDATHPDLPFGSKVIQNVKVTPNLFGTGPLILENLPNTDTSGHGTHVDSTAAGTGTALGGKYSGVAIGANLVGVAAGETVFVLAALEGFDWVLRNVENYRIRVISNSWGTTGSFSPDDPINVASRMAHDVGIVVLFAAGNGGPGLNSLNPYCVPSWVICVAAGNKDGRTLANFSSRGIPGDPLYHPTITAPGVGIAAARATTGIVLNTFFAVDLVDLGSDAIWYAAASGASMATPHVSGTVALMLEANRWLTPDRVKSLLEDTASPMAGYGRHEVGAGYLNAYNAVNAARLAPTSSDVLLPSTAVAASLEALTISGTGTVATDASDNVGAAGSSFTWMAPH